jgi:hypothetical protein
VQVLGVVRQWEVIGVDKMRVILVMLLLAGCSTISVCDYNIAANGWSSVAGPPENLESKSKDSLWFTNADGDFLVCHEMKRKSVCDNYYQIYKKRSDGTYEHEEILCIE